MLDAKAAAGQNVSVEDRLGDTFHGSAHHTAPHKWAAVTWKQATAAATTDTVYLGDKGKGKQHYHQFNATWVPDVIRLTGDGGMPELLEIKNYSPLVRRNASSDGPTEHMGHEYALGNTEEALKWRVLGTRQRAVPAAGPYDHKTGTGYVKAHRGVRTNDTSDGSALDVEWARLQCKDRWLLAAPKLGLQRASFSDIQKKRVDYGV